MRISALCLRTAIAAVPLLTIAAARAETPSEKPAKPARAIAASPATLADGAYELAGFFGTGDKLEVSLKKAGETESKWVRVGQKTGNLLVESADPKKGFAIVNIAGARYRLNLRGEKATVLPSAEPMVLTGSGTLTLPSSAKLSPEARDRRERYQALVQKLTPEQNKIMSASAQKRMDELVRQNPNGIKDKELMRNFKSAMKEGLRDALKTPDKDGNPGVVPEDFDRVVDEGAGSSVGMVTTSVDSTNLGATNSGAITLQGSVIGGALPQTPSSDNPAPTK